MEGHKYLGHDPGKDQTQEEEMTTASLSNGKQANESDNEANQW